MNNSCSSKNNVIHSTAVSSASGGTIIQVSGIDSSNNLHNPASNPYISSNPQTFADFALKTSSSGNNAGTQIAGLFTDINGTDRNNPPDIGVVESGGTSPPPTGLTNLYLIPNIEGVTQIQSITFEVDIYGQGGNTTIESFSIIGDSQNRLLIPSNNLDAGTYDILIKTGTHLGKRQNGISFDSNQTYNLPEELLAGDLNGDDVIDSLDWSVMSSFWFTNSQTVDINRDSTVNSIDFSFISTNWFSTGD